MGLASALTTALTGMQAAETQVDVVGNNLANSQTVAFKASEAVFATQFLQTQSLGSVGETLRTGLRAVKHPAPCLAARFFGNRNARPHRLIPHSISLAVDSVLARQCQLTPPLEC